MNAPLPPIKELLLHRGTMLLLDEATSFSEMEATCSCRVARSAWYSNADGAMPGWIGIELMAQTIAAHVALLARSRGLPPKAGALLGTRQYSSQRPFFAADEELFITARKEFHDSSGLGAYDCHIALDDVVVASATLKVFEPEDFDEFIAGGKEAS